ncbi:MAG: glycogen/starch/alpha-glucan phosphorylase [Coprococcus sp.]
MQENAVKINPQSVFDIQVKRLHEYKASNEHCMSFTNTLRLPNIPDTRLLLFSEQKAASIYDCKR